MVLAFSCVKAGFYYAIRRGIRWAKVVVAVACLGLACTNTIWREGYVAGMNFTALPLYSLLVLLKNLLVLAALVLLLKKPRIALRSCA